MQRQSAAAASQRIRAALQPMAHAAAATAAAAAAAASAPAAARAASAHSGRKRGRKGATDQAGAVVTAAANKRSRRSNAAPAIAHSSSSSSDDSDSGDAAAAAQSVAKPKRGSNRGPALHSRRPATRPYYSSEEEEDAARVEGSDDASSEEEDEAKPAHVVNSTAAEAEAEAAAQSTDPELDESDLPPATPNAYAGARRRAQQRLEQRVPHHSLTVRLWSRREPVKQWAVPLAERKGEPVTEEQRGGYGDEDELHTGAVAAGAKREDEDDSAARHAKLSSVSASFSRPFDIVNNVKGNAGAAASSSSTASSLIPAAAAAAFSGAAAAVSSSTSGSHPNNAGSSEEAPRRYWSYHASGITRIRSSPGYSITDHANYTDAPVIRASPPLTARELAALTPVSAEEACRENGLTLARGQRVKLSPTVRAQVRRAMQSVTGEVDRKVLSLCEHGHVSKCRLYRTDRFNITLMSTERLLSGEPIGAWMGTLRTRRTFAQRVGLEHSLAHLWAYETPAGEMGPSYLRDDGPDLVHDGSAYGNETHFLRDPKWSHQRADANIACRLVWHQKLGLPFIAFVTLCDIEPHAELFIDWGDKCWKNVWRTQLTALATYSHMQHAYLKSLQHALRAAGKNVLPQQGGAAASRFSVHPPPTDEESEEQRRLLDEEVSPFATTSAVTLSVVAAEQERLNAAKLPLLVDGMMMASSSSSHENDDGEERKEGPRAEDVCMMDVTVPRPAPAPAPAVAVVPTKSASARASRAAERGKTVSSESALVPAALGSVPFEHARADAAAAASAAADSDSDGSTPSSPFTPSFNTHNAFCASTSRTMLTVFASALLHENTRELARIARRIARHRANRFRRVPKVRKPLLLGAMHVQGQHTFELMRDTRIAFIQSGTRLGREAKVDVSEETKRLIHEAFQLLRPCDFPERKDESVIADGGVPKAAIYEVVGLKHPARFFTRPDQHAFALVATKSYARGDAIGTYVGVYRDFEKFHEASDADATKQVYAYDLGAAQVPGPPNPWLSEEQKQLPLDKQLCYRGGDLIIESLYYGNEVRFMNDAYGRAGSDATVNARASIVWDRVRQWPCILVRAIHPIERGDEIICDYGDDFWNKVARSLMMDHASYGDECRELILSTEAWCRLNGVTLPERPSTLPSLFTTDRANDVAVYPAGFLKDAQPEEGAGALEEDCQQQQHTAAGSIDKKEAMAERLEPPHLKRKRLDELQRGMDKLARETAAANAPASVVAASPPSQPSAARKTALKRAPDADPLYYDDDDETNAEDETMQPPLQQLSSQQPAPLVATEPLAHKTKDTAAAAAEPRLTEVATRTAKKAKPAPPPLRPTRSGRS